MMERTLVIAIAHGLATGFVLKLLSFLVPTYLVSYYTDIGHILLCLYVAKITLPLSKKRFLSERIQPENKAVFITGCDSGFGHHLAKRLDDRGYHVFASCLFPSGDGANSLRNSSSKRLHVLGLDITNEESVKKALCFVKENLEKNELWAIVNNAGVLKALTIELSSIDEFRETLEINAIGAVRVTKAFLPLLRQSKGRVINLTSLAGRVPLPNNAGYTMSKAAAIAFTACLKQEMDSWGVKSISIEPEIFKTPMTSGSAIPDALENPDLDEQIKEDYGKKYFQDIKSQVQHFLNNMTSKEIHLVLDALESAISLEQPDAIYKVCRNELVKFFVFLIENLPQVVIDVALRIYIHISGYPIPEKAKSEPY